MGRWDDDITVTRQTHGRYGRFGARMPVEGGLAVNGRDAARLELRGVRFGGKFNRRACEPELRTSCAMETSLSFHQAGLAEHMAEVRRVIEAHEREQWVSELFPLPPMVPMRLAPRNVIMQPRTRALPDGTLEDYLKPRVTFNTSGRSAASPRSRTIVGDVAGETGAPQLGSHPPLAALGRSRISQ